MTDLEEKLRQLRAIATASAKKITASLTGTTACNRKEKLTQVRCNQSKDSLDATKREASAPFKKIVPSEKRAHAAEAAVLAVAAAAAADAAAVAAVSDGSDASTELPFTIAEVPDEFVGILIGKHGECIRQLQADTGALVCVGKLSTNGMRKVCITGCVEKQALAHNRIIELVAAHREKEAAKKLLVSYSIEVPERFMGYVIGKNGDVINRVKESTGVKAVSYDGKTSGPLSSRTKLLELRGTADAVANAREQVERVLLDLYRRHRIFNAPLEQKYGHLLVPPTVLMTEWPAEDALQDGEMQDPVEADLDSFFLAWAHFYKGNPECIALFLKLKSNEDPVHAPGT